MSYTIFIFSFVLLFWLPLDFVMPQHLFHVPYSITNNSSLHPPSHIPCPPPILHHLITPSPSFLSSVLSLSHHLFHISVFWLLASPFCSILIFLTSVHYSLPPHSDFVYLTFCPLWLCESFSTFSVLLWALWYISFLTCSLFLSLLSLIDYSLSSIFIPSLLPISPSPLVSPLLVSSEIEDNLVPWQGCNT